MKMDSEVYKKQENILFDIKYECLRLHIYIYNFFYQNRILNNDDSKCLMGCDLCDAPVMKKTDEFKSGMKIFIKTIDDKILTLEMRHSNKIRDVKIKIEEKTNLSLDEQNLFFQGEILSDDNKTICEYQICDRSEINIVGRLRGGMENYFYGRKDEVQIRNRSVFFFGPVSERKKEILSQIEMIKDDKISKGESMNDYSAKLRMHQNIGKTKIELCMNYESKNNMIWETKNKIQILIKISNKSIIPISIDKSSKIIDLKLKIEKQTGIQFAGINLIYGNEILNDEKLLIDYKIEDGCVVSIDNGEFFSFFQAIKSGLFESFQDLYDDDFYEMLNQCKPSPLHYACKQHNADIVKYLIGKNLEVNSFDNECNRPIHYACINNHVEILKTLIENKCDIEVCDAYKMRPIHLACLGGNFRNVKLLIENGCKLESQDYLERRPIHLACLAGNIDIVKLLIQNKCEIDVIDKTNKSPLNIAQHENHTDIIKIIKEEKLSRKMIEKMIDTLNLKCDFSCDHKFCLTSLHNKTFNKGIKIGHGSFGTIYRCKISESSHQIVIKKISTKEISSDLIETNINRFIDKINHKRIIKYFGAIRKDENSFIFMEFMPGGSIRSQISKKPPMASNKVLQFTKQILEGLQFLHDKKIIHRDIKPDHILLDKDENVKLTDFGLGISSKLAKTFCGTANYMAPEVIIGEMYSYKVDIWSLGATVIEMLTGKPPYSEFVPAAVMFKIGTTKTIPYQLPESSTNKMNILIDKMLIPDPNQRPDAKKLIEFLKEIK